MEFKQRFKGKTSLMGKDGHIGVVRQASNPIDNDFQSGSFGGYKPNVRHKRAISQDYSFNTDLPESGMSNGYARSIKSYYIT